MRCTTRRGVAPLASPNQITGPLTVGVNMDAYQEERLTELLNVMAEKLAHHDDSPHETIGGLSYLVWEARKTLELPDIEGLGPL